MHAQHAAAHVELLDTCKSSQTVQMTVHARTQVCNLQSPGDMVAMLQT